VLEPVWGDLDEPYDRYGKEKQLRQTVAPVELLFHGKVIID
jgi:hypothetical protein